MSAKREGKKRRRHGRQHHYIDGEGWVKRLLYSHELLSKYAGPDGDADRPDPMGCHEEPPQDPDIKFCRLFEASSEQPSEDALMQLGLAMENEVHGVGSQGDSDIPAGYTYLGQFIDHDITAQVQNLELGSPPVDPATVTSERTPALDLDSVYGDGPSGSPGLYEADGVHLRIGMTAETLDTEPGGPIAGGFPNDLPREGTAAVIGDPRNDENLAVAQTHLAFLKFHNRIADQLKSADPTLDGDEWFQAARKQVTLHYQSIILNDFLPRILETDILQETVAMGPKFYDDSKKDCMPVEVAAAAFRLGHSMVRPSYEWNKVFNSGAIPATFELLFEFSGGSGSRGEGDAPFFGKPKLPSNWIVNWKLLYDFSGVPSVGMTNFQKARKLDANMAMALQKLPEFESMGGVPAPLLSLATRNLLRGRQFELPTGQMVAQAIQGAGFGFTPITAAEIANGPHRQILEDNDLHEKTPLWYYIIREAKIKHDGNRLGPVGSRLCAEFFVGAIQRSEISIFDETEFPAFTMPQLLATVGDLNPLEPSE